MKPLLEHVEAERKAKVWVKKALDYRAAGKEKLAKQAEEKAKVWLAKAMTIEERFRKR